MNKRVNHPILDKILDKKLENTRQKNEFSRQEISALKVLFLMQKYRKFTQNWANVFAVNATNC